ncbi:hypothetical protein [Campylobacter sp. RM16192]|uniref:hypothetical protein n=1 Tax=Campylobacter sp. RM16192 TaxID=1660080 RepID=UPI0014528573|nr:hypothetical protein [Campylobacter sp. RM16192]QCD52799.1 hypothetical protein CDOMC_1192 [Campylobacter sp. RM16192]
MLVKNAKEILAFKTAGGIKLPPDEMLSELFFEAILYVSNKCVPSELLRSTDSTDRVYRLVEGGHFICYPDKPNFKSENEHLMIDEDLTYAVINYVAFIINQDPFYRTLSLETIADFNANEGRVFDYE